MRKALTELRILALPLNVHFARNVALISDFSVRLLWPHGIRLRSQCYWDLPSVHDRDILWCTYFSLQHLAWVLFYNFLKTLL